MQKKYIYDVTINLSKIKNRYFLTDSYGSAYEASWNQIQDMLRIYVEREMNIKINCTEQEE